jgi:hypothetical protein
MDADNETQTEINSPEPVEAILPNERRLLFIGLDCAGLFN